ncbi:MAG: hypothetical protein ACLTKG_05750 [Collinsella intestinalis]
MEIFNATNLVYILGGFIKTIEISVLSIICSVVVGTVLALRQELRTPSLPLARERLHRAVPLHA